MARHCPTSLTWFALSLGAAHSQPSTELSSEGVFKLTLWENSFAGRHAGVDDVLLGTGATSVAERVSGQVLLRSLTVFD